MRVLFYGTPSFALPTLEALLGAHHVVAVVTQPDKPAGRGQRVAAPPVKERALAAGVPVLQPPRLRDAGWPERLRELGAEIAVVVAFGQILPEAVLDVPARGSINIHASLLPRYRGAAPIQAAIVAGDRETGITVMYMDEGLDTGDALLEKRIEIAPAETGGSLHDRLAEIAPAALQEALALLAAGSAPRLPQDSSAATYAPKLERQHGRIDWCEPAILIERKIRAFDPWPGAFTILRDDQDRERKLKIHRATVVAGGSNDPGNLVIAAKDAALRLEEVQLEGKRRMSATEFLRGYNAPVRIA